jgi:hypothetical protein
MHPLDARRRRPPEQTRQVWPLCTGVNGRHPRLGAISFILNTLVSARQLLFPRP